MIHGGPLQAITYTTQVASAQVKARFCSPDSLPPASRGSSSRLKPRPHRANARIFSRQSSPRGKRGDSGGGRRNAGSPCSANNTSNPRFHRSGRHFKRCLLVGGSRGSADSRLLIKNVGEPGRAQGSPTSWSNGRPSSRNCRASTRNRPGRFISRESALLGQSPKGPKFRT